MNTANAVIFARSNHGHEHIQQQVDQLRHFAEQRGLQVVSEIGLPHTSATDSMVDETLVGLIAKSADKPTCPTLLVTDLSRLSRRTEQGTLLLFRLEKAGWKVISADGSFPSGVLSGSAKPFHKKKVVRNGNAKNSEAGDPVDAEDDDGRRSP